MCRVLCTESNLKYKNIEVRVKTRRKRKLRFAQTKNINDPEFLKYLTMKIFKRYF